MLKEDYELSREDIQLLSSRDALAAFFAKLGYDTNDRLVQHVAAMGFTSDNLKSAITHIERLASQDARMFEVYLFELKSVTVASTQGIVRAFRNRPGDYMVVLTDDYQRLDFVLVERYSAEFPKQQETFGLPSASKQVGVRPRVLTVNRRNPEEVALRVLRRFTYTEGDTFAQYDKLLSAYDVANWSEPFFNNRALFSDYYLTTRLPESPEWKSAAEAGAMTRAFRELRGLYADVRETFSNQTEDVVRARLLEPVLSTLGFVARSVKASNSGEPEPDYRLYLASAAEHATDKPLALCLAYTWGRNLDGKDEQRGGQSPNENPGAVVVTLLDSGEADWAIVTNGKTWRLYSAKAHSRATNYYEIDLEETLAQSPAHLEYAFRYFWLFFRAAAFIPSGRIIDGEKRQICFLDSLVSESERYARKLGEQLKERVFFEIFPYFARGFIIYARRAGQLPANLDSLETDECNRLLEPFFGGTLTFLYRLLFLLYAESRDLLPAREVRGYHEKSLEKLKWQVAAKAGNIEDQAPGKLKAAYNDLSTTFYDRLQELFNAVDKGDAALNVPVYNGGLFMTQPDPADTSPEADVARFLSTCKIPDRELALGLDLMARNMDEKRQDLAFIDYKSLGVRQLGSIYEGLLEFKLRVAAEEMAVVKGKKTEEIVPYTEAKQKKLPILKEGRGKAAYDKTYSKGKVYLENDRRERKATGSYYTPDYIVKYIVEHTVGPVLAQKIEALRPIFREAEKTLKGESDKVKALGRKDISAENETYKKYRETLNEAFFDLKVLDPAMGSGHFLVEAVDYITDQLAKILTSFKWNPIIYELAQTRHEIQQEMERQGVTIDMSKLTDLNLLKRRVLKSCIYGVDLNPMAVELAKVSLWLDCFTLGAPLSFLDHHMKCGNSLIGGRIDEARMTIEEGQLSFFGSSLWAGALLATESMIQVSRLSDVTDQQVRDSKQRYFQASDALAPFKHILDIYVSRWFGNEPSKGKHGKAGIDEAVDFLRSTEAEKWYQHPERTANLNAEQRAVVTTTMYAAQQHRFFHWELEFPEVFFAPAPGTTQAIGPKDNPGFDAVVGNPPYDVYTTKDADASYMSDMQYFETIDMYKDALGGQVNIFRLFIIKANNVVKHKCNIGQIVPLSLLADRSTKNLRKYLLTTTRILRIEAFPQKDDANNRIFKDAKLSTCILIMSKDPSSQSFIVRTHMGKYIELDSPSVTVKPEDIWVIDKEEANIPITRPETWLLLTNLYRKNTVARLDSIALCNRGEVSLTFNKDSMTKNPTDAILLKGVQVGRYVLNEHLSQGEVHWLDEAKFRSEVGNSQRLELVKSQRIVLQRITGVDDSRRVFGIIIPAGIFLAESTNSVSIRQPDYELSYIMAFLNSKLIDWRFRVTSTNNNVSSYELEGLPIRRISFITPPEERARLLEKAKNLYTYCMTKDDKVCVTGFVEHHLSKEPEESDVVHDLLAFLAEEMIRLNKEKRAAQKEFLDWLVTTLRILPDKEGRRGIDVLTGKSKLADYPGDYQKGESPLAFGELLNILQKNKGRLGVSLSDTGLVERVRNEYEGSLGRVLPLKERLAKTDALIDAVVYRLYGLTEEEIRVVEGKE